MKVQKQFAIRESQTLNWNTEMSFMIMYNYGTVIDILQSRCHYHFASFGQKMRLDTVTC